MGQCQGNSSNQQFKPIIEDVPGTKLPGFSSVFRKVGVSELQYMPDPNTRTVLDAYNNTVKKYPNNVATGSSFFTQVSLLLRTPKMPKEMTSRKGP